MSEIINHPSAIFSDADGTLVNTIDVIFEGQKAAALAEFRTLQEEGKLSQDLPLPDNDAYTRAFNKGVGGKTRDTFEKTFSALFEEMERPELWSQINFDRLDASLPHFQDKLAPDTIKAYDGLVELLEFATERDIPFSIITSGSRYHVVRNFGIALAKKLPDQLADLELLYKDEGLTTDQKFEKFLQRVSAELQLGRFAVVTCNDTPDTNKPHREIIDIAVEKLQSAAPDAPAIDLSQAVVLGDHGVDMELGVNANVRDKIGIRHGLAREDELTRSGATHTVDTLFGVIEMYDKGA